MGRKSIGRGQHLCICLALLSALTGCSLVRHRQERRDIRDTMSHGQSLFTRSDYDASITEYQKVVTLARERSPSDAALFNIGVIYVHPLNPDRDPQKAFDYFSQVVAGYPESAWWQQAQAWIGMLNDAKKSQQEIAHSNLLVERSKQDLENSRQELEKSNQAIEKYKADLEKSRLEIEKFKQVIEKSRQVDIEIEQKKRDRGR